MAADPQKHWVQVNWDKVHARYITADSLNVQEIAAELGIKTTELVRLAAKQGWDSDRRNYWRGLLAEARQRMLRVMESDLLQSFQLIHSSMPKILERMVGLAETGEEFVETRVEKNEAGDKTTYRCVGPNDAFVQKLLTEMFATLRQVLTPDEGGSADRERDGRQSTTIKVGG